MSKTIVWIYLMSAIMLALFVEAQTTNKTELLWPLPKSFQSSLPSSEYVVSPCEVNFSIQSPLKPYIATIIDQYLQAVFKCSEKTEKTVTMTIVVLDDKVLVPTQTKHENYSLIIRTTNKWELVSDYYPGFLRGL